VLPPREELAADEDALADRRTALAAAETTRQEAVDGYV